MASLDGKTGYVVEINALSASESAVQYLNRSYREMDWMKYKDIENLIPIPAPVVALDFYGESIQQKSFIERPDLQMRPQDLETFPEIGGYLVSFPQSNSLCVIDSRGNFDFLPMEQFGIQMIRGVVAIPNTHYVAVSDEKNGFVLLDVLKKKVRAFYAVPSFRPRHLMVASA